MSCNITKPTMWLCAQRRLRSAWASAQSDQNLRCPHEESGCPGWSESSLGAHSLCWFCHEVAQICSVLDLSFKVMRNEPDHEKTCLQRYTIRLNSNWSAQLQKESRFLIWATSCQNQQNDCAPSKDSDQPGHPPTMIRVFAVHSVGS